MQFTLGWLNHCIVGGEAGPEPDPQLCSDLAQDPVEICCLCVSG